MKTLLILSIAILLSGCITTSSFDNNEYQSFARLESTVRIAKLHCTSPDAVIAHLYNIKQEVEFLKTYTKYLPNNTNTYKISTIINKTIDGMLARYKKAPPSIGYCKAKFTIIEKQLQRSLESVGSKIRN